MAFNPKPIFPSTNPLDAPPSPTDRREDMNETEKQIVVMLAKEAARNQPIDGLPIWRAVLWAMFHPKQWARELGRFWALSNAIHAIERGEHRQHSPAKDD